MKKLLQCISIAGLLLSVACNNANMKPDTAAADNASKKSDDMKARYKLVDDAFTSGKLDCIDTLLSANSVDHQADTAWHVPAGPAGLKQMITMMRTQTPDLKSDIHQMVAEGNILMVYGTMSGTASGPWMGMPGNGKKWSADYMDVIKFGDDMKATEHWGMFDSMKMMQDMGMIPPMGSMDADKDKMDKKSDGKKDDKKKK